MLSIISFVIALVYSYYSIGLNFKNTILAIKAEDSRCKASISIFSKGFSARYEPDGPLPYK
jgi:hypothetical protein